MWYSAVNFGYRNKRLNAVLKKQIDTLPQLACQYLHEEKIRLATKLAQRIELTFEEKGRVHFNVGGYYKNVFTLAPSFYITEKEIDLGVDLFEEALSRSIKKLNN